MPQDFYDAYISLSVAQKKEAYDFIMFLSSKGKKRQPEKKKLAAFGILSKYANPSLAEKESGAWATAVAQKYRSGR